MFKLLKSCISGVGLNLLYFTLILMKPISFFEKNKQMLYCLVYLVHTRTSRVLGVVIL